MRQLFSKPLKSLVPFTQEFSYQDLQRKWLDLKDKKKLRAELGITDKQAQRLVTLGLSYEKLYELYKNSPQDFDEKLHKIGVKSEPLRKKTGWQIGHGVVMTTWWTLTWHTTCVAFCDTIHMHLLAIHLHCVSTKFVLAVLSFEL